MNLQKEKPESQEHKELRRLTYGQALSLSIEFGFIIVVPLLVFAFAGKWLDKHYQTHYFLLIGILLALLSSTLGLYKVIKKLADEIKKL